MTMSARASRPRARRRVRTLAGLAASAVMLAAWSGTARADVVIEGFLADAPATGSEVPQAAVAPGGQLTSCAVRDALTVVYTYSALPAGSTIQVIWFRNDARYFEGSTVPLETTDGRGFRSLSPDVADGTFRAQILVNGALAAEASVVKTCASGPPRVDGAYRFTITPLNIKRKKESWRSNVRAVCAVGACDVRFGTYGRTVRMKLRNGRYQISLPKADRANCVNTRTGKVVLRNAYRVDATISWRVVGQRVVKGEKVATVLRGRWTEKGVPSPAARALKCRPSTWTWRIDAQRVGG